ncbi:DNA binding transcription coactivator transcription factor [Dissophora globulifera]|uniref:DNA binding transcription coactivator transcription factor n=1 Tax=Dissophora globulifera TaxID=979702 RepID=A0A9P6UWQ1_9FUNG|nr:DNA binding transcription coactivator transcription factor [Dissophora globulifera]
MLRFYGATKPCTFVAVLGGGPRVGDSLISHAYYTTIVNRTVACLDSFQRVSAGSIARTAAPTLRSRFGIQCHHRYRYATKSSIVPPAAASAATTSIARARTGAISSNNNNSTSTSSSGSDDSTKTPWTRDDDRMLATLRRKKFDAEQLALYMPHHSAATIAARMRELEDLTRQKPTFQRWTPDDDEQLAKAVKEFGISNWNEISEVYFSGQSGSEAGGQRRSARSCQIRWKFLHPDTAGSQAFHKGPWSAAEVELFQELVDPSGANQWEEISRALGTRSAIQCHSQFKTVMHSGVKGKWTEDEVDRLVEAHGMFGNDWQQVARHVETRAPGQVRQKWNQFSEDVRDRLRRRRGIQAEINPKSTNEGP